MKIGLNLLNFGPGVSPGSLARWTREAEALGYHFAMISDHVPVTPDVAARYPAPFYDPLTTLAWLAGITTKLELGTTVLLIPYRNPILVARTTANIDNFSGGRFILGAGVGWSRLEFDALGASFHERGAVTDDYLAAILAIWTNEVASYEGRYVSFRDVHSAPMPLRQPHPPLWIGGASDAALRRAVRFGDAWHPINFRMAWLREDGLPRLQRAADAAGKPLPALCPRIRFQLTGAPMDDDERLAGVGTMDQVRRDLEELQALGAQYVLLDTYDMGNIEATRDHDGAWRDFTALAEQALDLKNETLR